MRQHYESVASSTASKLSDIQNLEKAAREAEEKQIEAEKAKERAEKKAEKASELTRSLQAALSSEKALSTGLNNRCKKLKEDLGILEVEKKGKEEEVKGLEETVRDLMFSLEAGLKIQAEGGVEGGEGGDLVVREKEKEKDKGKRKGKK